MSTMLQPRGPLPARVYWTRRLLVLTALVALVTVVGVLFASGGDGSQPSGTGSGAAAPDATSTAEPTEPGAQKPPAGTRGGDRAGRGQDRTDDDPVTPRGEDRADGRDPEPGSVPSKRPLAEPTGPCDPGDVGLAIDVSDAESGQPSTARLSFTSLEADACTLGITPDSLEVQVVSGDVVVWSSTDCPARLAAQQLVPRPDPAATYEFTWNGSWSTSNCGAADAAEPGGYWVVAGLIGGEPTRAYFDVT